MFPVAEGLPEMGVLPLLQSYHDWQCDFLGMKAKFIRNKAINVFLNIFA